MKWQQFARVTAHTPFDVLNRMRYDRATFLHEEDANAFERFISQPGIYKSISFNITRWSEDKKSLWSVIWYSGGGITIDTVEDNNWTQPELIKHETRNQNQNS